MAEVTRWLNLLEGDSSGELLNELYAELKKIARARMQGERQGHTLNATALVNEAWLRLEKSTSEEWRDRKHFYGAAAEAMRRILVEAARHRLAAKRGGGKISIPLEDDLPIAAPVADERLLEVHEVLERLQAEDETKAHIVKLRFFGGLKHEEVAALLDCSESTVRRLWGEAKTWLYDAIHEES